MMDMTSAELVAILGAAGTVGAAILALIGVMIANIVTRKLKERELFQSALGFLEGGTQRRAIGIAIVKKYSEANDMKDVAATIFLAQILHLQESKGSDRQIEIFNRTTMLSTLERWRPELPEDLANQVSIVLKK